MDRPSVTDRRRGANFDHLTMSVIICAYTTERWFSLQAAVASVEAQRRPAEEVIVVVDHNAELLDRSIKQWPTDYDATAPGPRVRVLASTGIPGLSGARNTGVAAARSAIVAFLDDDARADVAWSERLARPYADPCVLACGGAAEADLEGPRPAWWPLEFDWVVGCSYVGLPCCRTTVRNLIGANMSARRQAVVDIGGFDEGMGRVGTRPLGCEETDLFIRMAQRWPGARIVYEPQARVQHYVPAGRLSWHYFLSRCFAEGISKAKVTARVGRDRALASERAYVLQVLPRGMARGFSRAWHGDVRGLLQPIAIGTGLVMTSAGYVRELLARDQAAPFSPPHQAAA